MKTVACLLASVVALAGVAQAQASPGTITQVVASSGPGFDDNSADFDILLAAVQAANLAGALGDSAASLTVFAPTDKAFMQLATDLGWTGKGEADAWTFLVGALTTLGNGDPIPVLTNILKYHVVGKEMPLPEITRQSGKGPGITTLLGEAIKVQGTELIDLAPALGDAKIDVPRTTKASNGSIYPISRVLLPVPLP